MENKWNSEMEANRSCILLQRNRLFCGLSDPNLAEDESLSLNAWYHKAVDIRSEEPVTIGRLYSSNYQWYAAGVLQKYNMMRNMLKLHHFL